MFRSNFPLEFRVGNNDLSYGQKIDSFHPSNNAAVNQHWIEVGEQNFMEEDRELNSQFVSYHIERFAMSTVNRIVNYWTGAWVKPISSSPNDWLVVFGTSILSVVGFAGLW